MADDPNAHIGQTRPDQFDREIGWKPVFIFMLVITIITAAAFGTMWYFGLFMRDTMAKGDRPAPLVAESRDELMPPLPRLQTTSYDDWADMEADQQEQLSTYAWEDRSQGRVRIPVEEAMRRIADEGLPTFPPAPAPEAGVPAEESAPGTPVESN